MKLYECSGCGNTIPVKDLEQHVEGSKSQVTLLPVPFCCDTEMQRVERDARNIGAAT